MKFLIIAFLFLINTALFGQSFKVDSFISKSSRLGVIEGIVLDGDSSSDSLAFAGISVKNSDTTINIRSDVDGSFKLNIRPGIYTLKISFIGYEAVEIENVTVESDKTITILQNLSSLKIPSNISLVLLK